METAPQVRRLALLGGSAWLVVGGYGLDEALSGNDDGWSVAYAVFTVALVVAGVSTIALAALVSGQGRRPKLRAGGLVAGGLGCALAVVAAWALPAWMALLGAGFALVGVASATPGGRLVAFLAGAQVAAIAVLIAAIEAEVGRRDEWGDYPAAGGLALLVVAGLTIAGIICLVRAAGRRHAPGAVGAG